MRDHREGRRDVALTTLIDLLVQVVFVLTLLLLASDALQGSPEARGYVTADAWKTLVSIFDVDPKLSLLEQAKAAVNKFSALRAERDKAIKEAKEAEALRKNISELDRKIAELEAKASGGAPGLPPCRSSDGKEIVVLRISIDDAGQIANVLLPGANAIKEAADKTARFSGEIMSREGFKKTFDPWLTYGSSLRPPCKYTAVVEYTQEGTRADLQRALSAVGSIFRRQSIQEKRDQ